MNPYSINCAVKPVWREFEKPLKQDSLPAGAGFQEAPTLEEINARDAQRQQLINAGSRASRVHDELMMSQIQATVDPLLKSAYETALSGTRLSGEQGQALLDNGDLNLLGWLATRAKERFHPGGKVSFLLDRNINYTNICRIGCDFCAFYRRGPESDAYVLPKEDIFKKIEETIELGGTGTLMQGGVNPHLKIEYYEDLFRSIKERYKIHLHALSVIEIEGIAQVSRLTVEETLERLKAAGLDSIPGAGAEILSDEIRLEQSPVKRHSHRWIKVMQEAHKANLPTTATMMFGALEERKHVIEHILRIRDAQDETQGFYAFILWTFQGENTELAKKNPDMQPTSGVEYLRVLAVSRLMMDNIPNIQGSWVTMGPKIGQISLHYGANDMGSIMIEENVVSAAGTSYTLDRKNMIELIRRSGFTPVQRDTYYNILAEYPESPAE
ncbi:MAG: cyclic dehypoxanthinyl futalosine synthase [Silvanigrellaceae bacterium]